MNGSAQNLAATQYWATLPPDQLVRELNARMSDYVSYLITVGKLDRWQRNYSHYYGNGTATVTSSNKLTSVGAQGQYTAIKINEYRNLVQHQLILTTQNRPALRAKAANTDYKSAQQTLVAESILEYYLREEGHEKDIARAVELCLLYDDAYLLQLWDASIGQMIAADPTSGRPVHAGDVYEQIFGPFDVARDVGIRSGKVPWYSIRMQKNRWDLVAMFPAFKTEILAANFGGDEYLPGTYDFLIPTPVMTSDMLDCFLFLHEPTPAMPNGRLMLFLQNQWLLDGDLPYETIPLSRICPSEQDQTSFGYSGSNDLVGLQEAMDALGTIELSNQVNFGAVNVVAKKGTGFSWSQLGQGFNLFEMEDINQIKTLELAPKGSNVVNLMQLLSSKGETISGINSAIRGNPDKNLTSGTAIATVEAKAIQFLRGLEASYNQLLESWGSNLIEILKQYADEPRIVALAGKANRTAIRSFEYTKEDIANVSRVQVEATSALSKTFAGKMEMAKDLLASKLIHRAEEYLMVAETGRLERLGHDEIQDLLMITQENEALQEGKPVVALITDLHKNHIQSHRSLLNDPSVRIGASPLRQAVQAHILEHMQLLQQCAAENPMLLWATGQEMPPMGGGAPQGPPGGPPPPGNAEKVVNPTSAPEQIAQGVQAPRNPKNAVTGEEQQLPPQAAAGP